MKTINKKDLPIKIIFYVLTAVYGGLCFYLFYNQSLQQTYSDSLLFESDLPYHISMVVDDGWYYSLTALIYAGLYRLANGTVFIAAFLAICSAATVIATKKFLDELMEDGGAVNYAGALCLNFVMPFFIRWAGMYRYVSYQSPNVWHNSTYICMRLCAVIFMYFFVKYEKDYKKENLNLKKWLMLTILLALTTFVKPSFLTVFAPALALKLLWDLIKNKIKFIRVFLMGLTVIPSLAIILWQNSVLFGDDSSGYKISFMETFSFHADHPKVTVLLSLSFPIIVFLCIAVGVIMDAAGNKTNKKTLKESVKEICGNKDYIFTIIMAAVGFAEAILLIETGKRSRDGNFLWGYSAAMFFLYITSFKMWYSFLKQKRWIAFVLCAAVLVYQIVCGAIFFTRLISGETYFMIG
ncbi:MAG: hypothetical protein K5669_10835 [Lachnospiraceae bacterium]|nr:hypothetical protein [Lachnospiraceae bacterium]